MVKSIFSILEVRDIVLNKLEKRSFYSFLALYLGSSLLFVILCAYWYYSAQKNSLESETYYKLEHFADKLSGLIINTHMSGATLKLPKNKEFEYQLIQTDSAEGFHEGYFVKNNYKVLISSSPREHLKIKYILVKTESYFLKLHELQKYLLTLTFVSVLLIVIISIFLAKLFMRPVHTRIEQIENFIQDVSHELNTPITALKMSASRAIKKEVYDKKILTNISISTKQLESIYNSLTYLNFNDAEENTRNIELKDVLQRVINYYEELTNAKEIKVVTSLESVEFKILESRAELLFSNLLSNAIKYSMPQSTISIKMHANSFVIKDEGIGIATDKLQEIFELYKRDSSVAGGFGVGLSIVKQICDDYKIAITVDSELGKGSEFKLKF